VKEEWATTSLGVACDVIAGQSPAGSAYNSVGKGLPFYQGKKEFEDKYLGPPTTWTTEVTKRAKTNDILMSVRAPVGPINFATREICIGRGLAAIRAKSGLDQNFLFYFLLSIQSQISGRDGAVFPSISRNEICSIGLSIPPLPEQQRVVAVLDEAFAGLSTATANAEKNLKNARELFESCRESIFETKGEDWIECVLGRLVEIKHGFAFKSECFTSEGDYVLLTPGNFFEEGGYRDRGDKQKYYVGEIPAGFILRKGDFLIAMTEQAAGLLGSSIIVPEDNRFLHNQRLGLVQLKPDTQWSNEFFFHTFNTRHFRQAAHDSASGVKVRHTSPTKLGEITVSLPKSREGQSKVARRLDDLLDETERLGEKYKLKLSQISELKQSILCKAFSGELTNAAQTVVIAPTANAADMRRDTALVIALAYERHKRSNRDKSFGHTKEQKILHMVEVEAGFNLGRQPTRDAAGPNDFHHMLAAEEWAETNRYFRVTERATGGYQFQPLARLGQLLNVANSLDPATRKKIERVIDVFIPMDMQQAEVFATVYAAWNNLLIEGKAPTDDEIVRAAREEWHSSKLDILRAKFVEGLRQVRASNFVPRGRGRFVPAPAQGALPL
jgi:type I restriction enzyme, S subunit